MDHLIFEREMELARTSRGFSEIMEGSERCLAIMQRNAIGAAK